MTKLDVAPAESAEEIEAVRRLCRDFRTWMLERCADEAELIEAYYPVAAFEALIVELPALHAPPQGAMLLARVDGAPVGCAMYGPLEDGVCEMKRLYVAERARGLGVARLLCARLFETARAAGYRLMRLDTAPFNREAQPLYRALGFRERPPYYDPGPLLRDRLVFMERTLDDIVETAP